MAREVVPRWLRMALRVALLTGVVALPALAVKDPAFEKLINYRSYSIAFMVLGILVLPIWEPKLGQMVVIYTLLVPMACAAVWLVYGLFAGCPNLIFMMGACVVVTFAVHFTAELFSVPAGLLSIFTTTFVANANTFVAAPHLAKKIAILLSVLLVVAALLATLVAWLVFPEFCLDEVLRYHHEGLEHLLHLAHHAFDSKPPPLLKRAVNSSASAFGEGSKWRKVFSSADEHAAESGVNLPLLDGEQPDQRAAAGVQEAREVAGSRSFAVERSWVRVHMALQAANRAQVGAKAEVVVAAVAHTRLIVPCVPLLPCAKGQVDDAALKALQHVAVTTSLHIYKLFSACNPLDEGTEQLMHSLMSSQQWNCMRAALLASLQELVDAFPTRYYPTRALDRQHLAAFQAAVEQLAAAWSSDQLAHNAAAGAAGTGASSSNGAGAGAGGSGSCSDQQVLTVSPDTAAGVPDTDAAAALGDVFSDPLVPAGSAAAGLVARLHAAMLIRMLKKLAELLQQLYEIATAVSDSMLRFRCC